MSYCTDADIPAQRMSKKIAWAHGSSVRNEWDAPASLNTVDTGVMATGPPGPPHWVRYCVSPAYLPATVDAVNIRFRAMGGASIVCVSLYDCEVPINTWYGSWAPTSYQDITLQSTAMNIEHGGLAIIIEVNFPAAGGRLDIAGVGVEYH